MNPRKIDKCIRSIQNLRGVDKLWLVAYSEQGLERPIADFIESTHYDNYLIVSDDVIVTQDALEWVLFALGQGDEAATGWCNLSAVGPARLLANLTRAPLEGEPPTWDSYRFYDIDDVRKQPESFETWLMGHCLSGMTRSLWRRFPFRSYPREQSPTTPSGYGSDYNVSMRLQRAGVDMRALRDARCIHLGGPGTRHRYEGLQIGIEPPHTVFEEAS